MILFLVLNSNYFSLRKKYLIREWVWRERFFKFSLCQIEWHILSFLFRRHSYIKKWNQWEFYFIKISIIFMQKTLCILYFKISSYTLFKRFTHNKKKRLISFNHLFQFILLFVNQFIFIIINSHENCQDSSQRSNKPKH